MIPTAAALLLATSRTKDTWALRLACCTRACLATRTASFACDWYSDASLPLKPGMLGKEIYGLMCSLAVACSAHCRLSGCRGWHARPHAHCREHVTAELIGKFPDGNAGRALVLSHNITVDKSKLSVEERALWP